MKTIEVTPENNKFSLANDKKINFDSIEENLYFESVLDIDPKELKLKQDQVVLIDVREPEEFTGDLGHIPGAKLIGLHEFAERITEVDSEKTIVFVCRNGSRSARACALANEMGLKGAFNLKGGMILWNELRYQTQG